MMLCMVMHATVEQQVDHGVTRHGDALRVWRNWLVKAQGSRQESTDWFSLVDAVVALEWRVSGPTVTGNASSSDSPIR